MSFFHGRQPCQQQSAWTGAMQASQGKICRCCSCSALVLEQDEHACGTEPHQQASAAAATSGAATSGAATPTDAAQARLGADAEPSASDPVGYDADGGPPSRAASLKASGRDDLAADPCGVTEASPPHLPSPLASPAAEVAGHADLPDEIPSTPLHLHPRRVTAQAIPALSPINIRQEVLQNMQIPTPVGANCRDASDSIGFLTSSLTCASHHVFRRTPDLGFAISFQDRLMEACRRSRAHHHSRRRLTP